MFRGSGSISRARRITDLNKWARNREPINQPRTFMRGRSGDLWGDPTSRERRDAMLISGVAIACTKTELRRYKKQSGCTRAQAMRFFI